MCHFLNFETTLFVCLSVFCKLCRANNKLKANCGLEINGGYCWVAQKPSSHPVTPLGAPLTNFICNQIGKHVTIYLYIANRKCPIWIGAQGQIQVLIENSSLNHFCTIRIHKTNQFSSILFHRIRYKNTFFWVCSLLILGPNHISSITVHNTIFFRFCRHYFLFWAKCFDDGFGRTTGFENWLPRILRTSSTSSTCWL